MIMELESLDVGIPDGYTLVKKRPDAELKTALMGEFNAKTVMQCTECDGLGGTVMDVCEACEGAGEYTLVVPVTWTTIKAIHQALIDSSKPGVSDAEQR